MSMYLKHLAQQWTVQLLFSCLALFAPLSFSAVVHAAPAIEENIPKGWESYLDRPDILELSALPKDLGTQWEILKAAHFSLVAELLGMYPKDTHIYFLARDSEHLYDVARMATEGTADADRIHLLNVSRANMKDKNIKGYLEENGISDETLKNDKKVLFVDTGFAGTIPRVISENFSTTLQSQLKTHLVVSANPLHPSSRAFLVHLNRSINDQTPASMHGAIISYEHMTRFSDRSSKYVFSNGQIHPISQIGKTSDGSVSKYESIAVMQDLKAEWKKPKVKARFQSEKTQIKRIKELLNSGTEEAKSELIEEIKSRKENSPEQLMLIAQIRDVFESQSNLKMAFNVALPDLGLKVISNAFSSTKNELLKIHPEWKPVLENPVDGISKLFKEKNWLMIGNLIDANVDHEINKHLNNHLFDGAAQGAKKDLQMYFIEKADSETLKALGMYTFSLPHTKDMKDVIRFLIEKGDVGVLNSLAVFTFSKPHTKDMKDLIQLLIEKGNAETLGFLARYTFTQPHTATMIDLIKLMIKRGDSSTPDYLARYTFREPHTYTPEYDVLRKSLNISSPAKRDAFIETELQKLGSTFSEKPLEPTKAITSSLKAGDLIKVQGRLMKVIKKAGEGRRGIVFKVQARDNKEFYALKTAKTLDAETIASLAQESSKALQWQQLKIPNSEVLVQEKEYVLKTWIEGIRGDEVIEKFVAGDKSYKTAAAGILKLVGKIRAQGAYVGDFRPANLIWDGKKWVIIDSGSIKQGMTLEEATIKWNQADDRGPKFERRWKMPLPALTCSKVHATK